MSKKVETRKDEIRYVTNDPKRMLDKYLTKRVIQKWPEDLVDEDTGKIVQIERSQVLFEAGERIDQNLLQQLTFYLQAGDIKEVEVSNQNRRAWEYDCSTLRPWLVQALIDEKKVKMLMYAVSVANVLEVAKDYIELHHAGSFRLNMVKEIDTNVILEDNFNKAKAELADKERAFKKGEIDYKEYTAAQAAADKEQHQEKKFYQLELKVTYEKENLEDDTWNFIVHTADTDRAMMVIDHYLKKCEEERKKRMEERNEEYFSRDYKLRIEKVAPIPVGEFVPKEFSEAYKED